MVEGISMPNQDKSAGKKRAAVKAVKSVSVKSASAKRLAAKGRKLLEKYHAAKEL